MFAKSSILTQHDPAFMQISCRSLDVVKSVKSQERVSHSNFIRLRSLRPTALTFFRLESSLKYSSVFLCDEFIIPLIILSALAVGD